MVVKYNLAECFDINDYSKNVSIIKTFKTGEKARFNSKKSSFFLPHQLSKNFKLMFIMIRIYSIYNKLFFSSG